MEIRTYKVYKFDELPDKAKQKALNSYPGINVGFGDWYYSDGMLDLTADEMKSRRIILSDKWWESTKPKDGNGNIIGEYPAYTGLIKYSSDIYFDLDRDNYIQFNNIEIMNYEVFRKWLRVPPYLWNKISIKFHNDRNNNTELELYRDDGEDFTQKEMPFIDRAVTIWNGKVRQALSNLKKDYEYLTSDEAIIETFQNDYNFTIDGKID